MDTIINLNTEQLVARVRRILDREAAQPGLEPWEVERLRELRAQAWNLECALEVWESHWAASRDQRR